MLEAWSGDSVAAYRVRPRRLTEMSEAIMRTGHRMSVSEHGRNEKHRTLSLSCGRRRVLYRHAGARNEMRNSSHDARLMRHQQCMQYLIFAWYIAQCLCLPGSFHTTRTICKELSPDMLYYVNRTSWSVPSSHRNMTSSPHVHIQYSSTQILEGLLKCDDEVMIEAQQAGGQ